MSSCLGLHISGKKWKLALSERFRRLRNAYSFFCCTLLSVQKYSLKMARSILETGMLNSNANYWCSRTFVILNESLRAKKRYLQNCEKRFPTSMRSAIRPIIASHNYGFSQLCSQWFKCNRHFCRNQYISRNMWPTNVRKKYSILSNPVGLTHLVYLYATSLPLATSYSASTEWQGMEGLDRYFFRIWGSGTRLFRIITIELIFTSFCWNEAQI